MPPTLRFPPVLNNLPLDSIGCYGTWKSLFPYRECRDGWDGMGWDGKGREVMGWEWGWGEVRHVENNKSPPGIIVAPFWLLRGSLWHPWGSCLRSFLSLGGCWCLLGPKPQKDTEIERTHELYIDAKRDVFLVYLSAGEH